MIISENPKPSIAEFKTLMDNVDQLLNRDALDRPDYYVKRNGQLLEDDVKEALDECAKGTVFENSIVKVSGQRFPDIVAGKYYGVEVKSTKDDHWTSTGSSILETTRNVNVERIYMTFGKLGGKPILFRSKPYESCLSGIAVTHMPRYMIDMRLEEGETIFDKIGIPYDELRNLENPIKPVTKYYRDRLKPGESLWWAGDSTDETVVMPSIRLWKNLTPEEKRRYTTYGVALFPEVFGGDYDRYAVWLTQKKGIIDPHIRDQFSSGGKENMLLSSGDIKRFPAVYRRVKGNIDFFIHIMEQPWENELFEKEDNKTFKSRLLNWCKRASAASDVDDDLSMDALQTMFSMKMNEILQ